MKKKVVSIIGTRPNYIKIAALCSYLDKSTNHIVIDTGQHYDYELSKAFLEELKIPEPDYNLNVGSALHGKQTAKMLEGCEKILLKEKPQLVIVYGDTNSTLAGALAATKLAIPVAHVESGTRSFNNMPEEINRIMVDHISQVLFCSSKTSIKNLINEGIKKKIFFTGDPMYDIFLKVKPKIDILKKLKISNGGYYYSTIHRQENTDDPNKLKSIITILEDLDKIVIMPLHPRTKTALSRLSLSFKNIRFVQPMTFSDNIELEKNSYIIITDSGGIQKEAYWLKVPCLTILKSTEWIETVTVGWNHLVEPNKELINKIIKNFKYPKKHPQFYGDGKAGENIVSLIERWLQ